MAATASRRAPVHAAAGTTAAEAATGLKIFLASIGTFVLLLIVVSVALNSSSNGTR